MYCSCCKRIFNSFVFLFEVNLKSQVIDVFTFIVQVLEEKLRSSGKIIEDFNLAEQLQKYAADVAQSQEQTDISQQVALFDAWNEKRQELVDEQIAEFRRSLKRKEIEKRLEELREQELRLTFFENKERIRLMMKRGKQVQELEELFQSEEYLHWSQRP